MFLVCLKIGSTYLHRSCSCMHACVLVVVIVCWELELVSMRLHPVILLLDEIVTFAAGEQRFKLQGNSLVELGLSWFKLLLLFTHSQCGYGYLQKHHTQRCITLFHIVRKKH